MIDPSEVKKMVQSAFPEAEVNVRDQTGTFDHFEIFVASPRFFGKSLVEQHRMVQAAVGQALADGAIHAVQIKAQVPK